MQQHLENQIQTHTFNESLNKEELSSETTPATTATTAEILEEDKIHRFIKKDMKKTIILSTLVFLIIFGIYYYLNSTNSISKVSNYILK